MVRKADTLHPDNGVRKDKALHPDNGVKTDEALHPSNGARKDEALHPNNVVLRSKHTREHFHRVGKTFKESDDNVEFHESALRCPQIMDCYGVADTLLSH